ncbi:MAG: heavy metal-responsive transcriptional regulator [Nitrospira sp.]|nr:heavy metal-responsive transcriptional regulator [Nitrospira sp.]
MALGWTIGQLSKMASVNVQTVRYYERRNLLQPTDRKTSGYRVYSGDALRRLRFIKNAQALGFTLHEIEELLDLRINSKARCGDIQRKAEAKLKHVEAKVRDLQSLEAALRRLIRTCRAGQPTDHCPILQGLEEEKARTVQATRRR